MEILLIKFEVRAQVDFWVLVHLPLLADVRLLELFDVVQSLDGFRRMVASCLGSQRPILRCYIVSAHAKAVGHRPCLVLLN